ncbi:MAG TPA: type IV secretory system conjugative DNA transfer family protein [Candidatus Binatia bacterium]|nr:type IV secretory system conjugative DNA transfer family protein [Candidatus Binatia bacterium]
MERTERRHQTPEQEHHEAMIVFWWLCAIAAACFIWVANRGLHLRVAQIAAVLAVVGLPLFYLVTLIKYHLELPRLMEKQWPRPRLFVSCKKDRRAVQLADKTGDILLGYENDLKPVIWTQDQRAMQTNLPGMSGAGKTTTLKNVIEQDIRHGHPLIYFDGKGDKELVLQIWNMAFAAGRGDDVRIIDPTHPEISDKFNPFFSADGYLQARVGSVFDSLGASQVADQFFAEHQRAFLNAVTTILEHSGKQFGFWDVLVACQQEEIMTRMIENVRHRVMSDPNLPDHKKNGFMLQAAWLKSNYDDKNWPTLIRGLMNSMLPFVGDSLALITGACDNLVTFEEIAEKKQILIVSMNLGTDSQPARALGKILMRNLQFMIASRYNEYKLNQKHPFISIILDEFGLYAYLDFKNIIHTARQANAGFIFSFQSIDQLSNDVGPAFASDMATATNTKFMMRIASEDTARTFLQASASVPTERVSVRVEKGNVLDASPYVEEGSGTRQESMETRVKDHQVKMLPTGQMMALLPDHGIGVAVKHVHVRRTLEAALAVLPEWLPALKTPKRDSMALNLRMDAGNSGDSGSNGTGRRRKANAVDPGFGEGVRAILGGSHAASVRTTSNTTSRASTPRS